MNIRLIIGVLFCLKFQNEAIKRAPELRRAGERLNEFDKWKDESIFLLSSVRVRKILPSVFDIALMLGFTPLPGHATLTTTTSRSLLSSALNKSLVFRHHAASASNRTLPGRITCETMSSSTGTAFPTLRSVTIPYTDLKVREQSLF